MMKKLLMTATILALVFTHAAPAFADTIYTVRPGDTLFLISVRFNVSMSAIMSANGIVNPNLILVGQQLIIPTGGGSPSQPTPQPTPVTGQRTYVVQSGDWLAKIAQRFGVTLGSLLAANGLTISSRIFPGQVLIIPGAGAPVPAPTTAPSQPTPPPTTGSGIYIVQRGDWLSRIAARFGVSLSALMAANGITNPNLIFVGQRLIIPGQGAPAPTPTPSSPTPAPTTQPTAPPPPASPGGFELGGHVESFAYPDKMKYAGMYWVKKQIRWSPGMSAATVTGGAISDAHAKGFKILLGIVGHPGDIVNGANYDNYAAFVGEAARLGADAIEVWNEMNIDREWPAGQISPTSYTDLLRRAYNQIKAKNANTLVISGALAPTGAEGAFGLDHVWNDDRYIRGMAAAGAANYVDCIGVHYNEGVVSPTQTSGDPRNPSDYYSRYYQTMVSLYYNTFGGARKLCFTELGYLTPEGLGPLPAFFAWGSDTSLAEQAQWLGEAANLAKNGGVVRLLIVWNVDFRQYDADPMAGFSIVRPNGTCPACDTLRAVTGGR